MGKPNTRPEGNPDTVDILAAWYELIVWNDDVNTFDWVIESLMEICHHTLEQATQCAYIIHFKGKYAVRKGSYELLHPMKEALIDRGIQATLSTCGEEV
ncbi:ATP-dependent Clp protease adaptor ClpS [Thermoflavifilum thermophilum]|uniref:ATP-dependent Clp protease adaptor protein ClpS n=1 Tax=Thermoflavifilum thermophilum TaxID=1393122 RepID=A0A1I7NKD5_9BACT|nr:ATP-dependent Clp protease adaptor ClpS [Thermoflavifilum thermophilum]SFV35113.1 ATP-dependent Clp protease adaptor protein ClpS [Thermoflavifilum thermophilum]